MFHWTSRIQYVFYERRGQILLPAVMLAPLFILLVYLLFEMSKLSMTKVRQQFALDSSAYSQMSSTSGYLNALAQINGPAPFRYMQDAMSIPLKPKADIKTPKSYTVFDAFYQVGAFPSPGPSHELGKDNALRNPVPSAESTDWQFKYYQESRKNWISEEPKHPSGVIPNIYEKGKDNETGKETGKLHYVLTSKEIADDYFFTTHLSVSSLRDYLTAFAYTGDIFKSQSYVYQDVSRNSRMFRESYFLNTKDCKRSECGKEAASVLSRYILTAKPWEIDYIRFYMAFSPEGYYQRGAFAVDLIVSEQLFDGNKLFQFAYLPAESRSKLRQLERGIRLKQKYAVPANRFNINLTQKYKPQVQNSVVVSCPRAGNNCVWPNPLSKYSVKVEL